MDKKGAKAINYGSLICRSDRRWRMDRGMSIGGGEILTRPMKIFLMRYSAGHQIGPMINDGEKIRPMNERGPYYIQNQKEKGKNIFWQRKTLKMEFGVSEWSWAVRSVRP